MNHSQNDVDMDLPTKAQCLAGPLDGADIPIGDSDTYEVPILDKDGKATKLLHLYVLEPFDVWQWTYKGVWKKGQKK